MREAIVPAPDVTALVARERRLSVATAVVALALVAATGAFVWNAMLAFDLAAKRVATAEAEADAARTDANAARLGASTAKAELEEGRATFASGIEIVNQAKSELLRSRSSLASVKDALIRSRNLATLRTGERDAARAEIVRLESAIASAGDRIATLTGTIAAGQVRILGGAGYAAIADTWLQSLRADLAYAEVRRAEAETIVATLQEHIGLSVALSQHLRPVTAADARKLADSSDRLGGLLSRVLDMQSRNTRFSSANKPGVGFNSPGFTGYVLGRVVRGKTMKSLPETDQPRLGDIIRYQNGFDMFLLEDAQGEPFVIGMTPVGIAALAPDFGVPRTGALSTGIVPQ